jgi:exonuclease SbcC
MYLKNLAIQNYQSHRNSEITFSEGVNAIVGASDSGKSTIFRAISWLLTNKPKGEAFRSRWGGKTLVEAEFSDGLVIGRQKDKESKDNIYYIDDQDYKVEQSGAVPDDVVTALNMDDINTQGQHDSPFLLTSSGGDVAKLLNKIANLTQIDTAISNIKSSVTANSREIKNVESQITELEKQQESFKYLEQLEKDVLWYETLNSDMTNWNLQIQNLSAIADGIIIAQKELNEVEVFLKAERPLEAAILLTEEETTVVGQIRAIESVIAKLETDVKAEAEIKTFLLAETEVEIALQSVTNMAKLQQEGRALQNIVFDIDRKQATLFHLIELITERERLYTLDMGDTCILCERSL